MNNSSLLGAIRRRWWIVILAAMAGAVIGAIPEPEKVEEQVRTFTATHTMVLNEADPNAQTGTVISPNQVTLFVTTGEVPARAAEAIEFNGNSATLASASRRLSRSEAASIKSSMASSIASFPISTQASKKVPPKTRFSR